MNSQIEISPEEWDAIETYLDAGEKSINEDTLWSIPNVQEKIAYIKNISQDIEDTIRRTKIKEFHLDSDLENSPNGVLSKNREHRMPDAKIIWYALAAMLAVLLGIFWLLETHNSSDRIFADYFKPDIGLPLRMGTSTNLEFYEGMVDYKRGEYQKAIDQWQILWNTNPQNDTLNYFLGVAHLARGQAEKSLGYLQDQDLFQQSIFNGDAAYYAALAYIKEGNFKQAAVLLKKHPSQRNTHLLKELEKE